VHELHLKIDKKSPRPEDGKIKELISKTCNLFYDSKLLGVQKDDLDLEDSLIEKLD
jgi:hypothetical protein